MITNDVDVISMVDNFGDTIEVSVVAEQVHVTFCDGNEAPSDDQFLMSLGVVRAKKLRKALKRAIILAEASS